MDCEACNDLMIELLYGELDDADKAAADAHLDECESCAEAYARLASGQELASMLALEAPDEGFRSVVMRAAVEKAGAKRASTPAAEPLVERPATPGRDGEEEDPGLWASIVHWIGGFAMRPQLAMALTLLLMVGIGLWYLPELRRNDPADAHSIIDPLAGDEVGPSASLEPAEPLDLQADPRTGRIRPRELEEQTGRPAVHAAEPAEPVAQGHAPAEEAEAEADMEMADGVGEVVDEALESPETALAELQIAPGEALPIGGVDDDTAGQQASTTTAPAYAEGGAVRAMPMPEPSTAPAPMQQPSRGAATRETTLATEGAGGSGSSAQAVYDRGMQRFQQRDYSGAAGDFGSVVRRPDTDPRRLLPAALHQLARSQRAANNCRAAVGSYQQLLSRYGTYPAAPNAMLEAADCYRRLGQLSQARRLLEDAQGHPAVASAATRELARLTVAERAAERLGTTEAEAAPAEAAGAQAP